MLDTFQNNCYYTLNNFMIQDWFDFNAFYSKGISTFMSYLLLNLIIVERQ